MIKTNYTILIVDENKIDRQMINLMLKDFTKPGFTKNAHIVSADSIDTAIDTIKNQNVDLVLTELRLGGNDGGYTLLTKVKDISKIPVIAQTAQVYNNDRERCLEAGFDNYISKPYTPAAINAIVRQYLN